MSLIEREKMRIQSAKSRCDVLDWLDIGADELGLKDNNESRPWNYIMLDFSQKKIVLMELAGSDSGVDPSLRVLINNALSVWDNLPDYPANVSG